MVACRSVHLGYSAEVGSAFYNELTVTNSSSGTYFMVCGWSKGYFGLQELTSGNKIILFSVWDPTIGDDPQTVLPEKQVKLLYRDASARVGRFGNEGTGGQSFFDYEWKANETYRFLVTAKPDNPDRTVYGGYFYIPERKEWKHLVSFSTITPRDELLRGCYSFVEDFQRSKLSASQMRKAKFGNGWIMSAKDDWKYLSTARFTADDNPVTNINAGAIGSTFFLATGGNTLNDQARLNETIACEDGDRELPLDLPTAD